MTSDPWATRWEEVSLLWSHIQPPVRPASQDIALLERLVDDALEPRTDGDSCALMLGVTPEIATMRWPAGTRLLALDYSEAMIRNVWPAREAGGALAVLADWTAMPVADAACDVVVGDGSFNMPAYPDGLGALAREARRVLTDDGRLVVRTFARPEQREPLDAVFADLRGGRIGNIDVFNWRLAMAVHGDLTAGVRLGSVWEAWADNVSDPAALMRSIGWPEDAWLPFLGGIQGFDGRMVFPTISELTDLLSEGFVRIACHVPEYETGERYPTLAFRPR